MNAYPQLVNILSRYLSRMNAEGILRRALRECQLDPSSLTTSQLPAVLPRLTRGIHLFLEPTQQKKVWAELEELCELQQLPEDRIIRMRTEADISEARIAARAMCSAVGARGVTTQKVATMVSELARNIVSYTPGGTITLSLDGKSKRVVTILAEDEGEGIPHLDQILSGRYRSRSGLGKGILGVKRLASKFDIDTGRHGTRIRVEIEL